MEQSKFAGALGRLNRSTVEPETPSEPEPIVRPEPKREVLERVRPRSKRSDPAWRPYTLMLKSETHTQAAIILKRMDTGEDLSDLAQKLFDQWVKANA
jgi:hypothetical protein